MALSFLSKYYSGSLSETFGLAATNNGSAPFAKTDKGYALRLNGSNQWVSYTGSVSIKSFLIWIKANGLSKDIIDFDGGTHSIEVGATNITATGFVSPTIYIDAIASAALPNNLWKCVVVTTATAFTANAIKIGKETSYFRGDIACIKGFNHTLTQEEINKEQAEFEAAKPRGKSIRNFNYPKPKDTSRLKGSGANQGLVAHYNMIPNADGSLTDISGNGKTATKSGVPMQTENGLVFHGSPDKYTIGNLGNYIKSIQFRIKLNSTSEKIIEGDINSHLIYVTNGTLTANTFNVIYIDGIVGTSMVAGKWHNVVLTLANTGLFRICTLALNDATYGQFEIEDLSFWNRPLSAQEAKEYNNKYASQKYLSEHFETLDCSGNNVLPDNWIAGTGLYKGYELPTDVVSGGLRLRKGTRFLQCTSAGTIALPSNWVNGAVEFDFYKGADANDLYFNLIASKIGGTNTPLGYQLAFSNSERINLRTINGGSETDKFYTATSYFQNNTYYRCRFENTPAGVKKLLIKGGNYVPTAGYNGWTLVSVTGGSGTNPVSDSVYNTSNFLVLDLDANDKAGNFDFYKGIVQW